MNPNHSIHDCFGNTWREHENNKKEWGYYFMYIETFTITCNLTEVRPLFTLLHRGSDNSPLLIVFSANYIDQSNRDFYATESISKALAFDILIWVEYMSEVTQKISNKSTFIIFKNTALCLKYANWLPVVVIMTQFAITKFTWTRSLMGSYQFFCAIV